MEKSTENENENEIVGSCLCGLIRFKIYHEESKAERDKIVDDKDFKFRSCFKSVAHCHCKMCRKFHGAAFSTFAEVEVKDFHLEKESLEYLSKYESASNNTVRGFCKVCGSSLTFESSYNRNDGTLEVALGCIDHFASIFSSKSAEAAKIPKADCHIYTDFKGAFYEIGDDDKLPQYSEYRDI